MWVAQMWPTRFCMQAGPSCLAWKTPSHGSGSSGFWMKHTWCWQSMEPQELGTARNVVLEYKLLSNARLHSEEQRDWFLRQIWDSQWVAWQKGWRRTNWCPLCCPRWQFFLLLVHIWCELLLPPWNLWQLQTKISPQPRTWRDLEWLEKSTGQSDGHKPYKQLMSQYLISTMDVGPLSSYQWSDTCYCYNLCNPSDLLFKLLDTILLDNKLVVFKLKIWRLLW